MSVRWRFVLLGAALALLVAEGGARLFGDRLCTDAPGVFYQADPRTGWTHVPGLRAIARPCEGGELPAVPVETGPTGLLDPPRPFEPPPGTLRVVLTGGNGPEGLGVRPEARMARQLEQYLRLGGGLRAEVIGAATGGWAIDNMLAWLRAEGFRYAPVLVVLVVEPGFELRALSPVLIGMARRTAPAKPFLRLDAEGRLGLAVRPPARAPAPPQAPAGLWSWSQLARTIAGRPSRSGPPLAWSDLESSTSADEATAELARVEPLAEAILRAIREEAAARGAHVLVALAPWAGEATTAADEDRRRLAGIVERAGVSVVDLQPRFRAAIHQGRRPFIASTGRWSATGHVLAAEAVFAAARDEGLLPVRPFSAAEAFAVPSLGELGRRVAESVWAARWSALGRFLLAALLATGACWAASGLGATGRAWATLGLSVSVLAVGAGTVFALSAGALAAMAYGAAHLPPRLRLPGLAGLLLGLVAAVLALGPALLGPAGPLPERVPERLVLALASGTLLLRVVAYGREQRRGGPSVGAGTTMAAILFFPTVLLGPFETPAEIVRQGVLPPAPGDAGALRARLVDAVRGLALLGRGVCLLALVPWLAEPLALVSATGGSGLDAPALWLWLGSHWALAICLFGGLSDLGSGLTRLVTGRRPATAFEAPWRASDPADFWRRWMTSFHRWIAREWYRSWRDAGRWWRYAAVMLVFAASAAWCARTALVLFGSDGAQQVQLQGLAGWAMLAGVSVVASQGRAGRAAWWWRPIAAFVGALGWVMWFWPPQVSLAKLGTLLGGLLGLH